MNLSLIGKNALVGGSSKGIGKAIAIELALLGANITLVARSTDLLHDVKMELDNSHGQHHDYLAVDYNDSRILLQRITAITELKPIHILINNTGGPAAGSIVEAEGSAFEDAFRQHLLANHLLTQNVIQGMKKEGYGRIINIISTSVKQPLENLGVSNTIRGAVANWAKTMANELGQFGITVNNVLPGATRTERMLAIVSRQVVASGKTNEEVEQAMIQAIPLGRIGEAQEVAAAVAFLASPAASYISGINLPVDGGRTKSL
ncbi:MAG: SDR family oxidoreductase [Saprospiraceae bacterium]|nr:SDR family oxidoreductase [Saprospiraceae bacterium]MBP7680160.1 SDR family oxidoreductase [Saprospiraceae bacterium]